MKGIDFYWIISDMLFVSCMLAIVYREKKEKEEKEKKEFEKYFNEIWGVPQQYAGQKTKKRAKKRKTQYTIKN